MEHVVYARTPDTKEQEVDSFAPEDWQHALKLARYLRDKGCEVRVVNNWEEDE